MNEDPRKKVITWFAKIRFLKEQIEKLEKLRDFPIIAVSVFLLKSQIIEFELRQVIFSLDLHLYSQNCSNLINRRVRTPRDLEDLTLGQLVREFRQFITSSDTPVAIGKKMDRDGNNIFNLLKQNLNLLVKKRNEFTHKLFSLGKGTLILTNEAQEGIKIVNKTLSLLESLEEKLKNYEK